MKSGLSHSLLALAAATLGMGGTHRAEGSPSRPMKLRPPLPMPNIFFQTLRNGGASQSPPYNQRKARKARRARFAAGDRHAFRR
jgi:hypothetical protein